MSPKERFRRWREARQLSATEVAKQLGCCRSYVYELERDYSGNDVYPSRKLAKRIQELTKISMRAWGFASDDGRTT